MSIPYNYIQTLKQLPRHGVSDDQRKNKENQNLQNKAEALKKVKLSAKIVLETKTIISVKKNFKSYSN